MLVKIGDIVLNSLQISYINLKVEAEEITSEDAVAELFPVPGQPSLKARKTYGVQVSFFGEDNLYFWDEEAELLRWYFNHPTSDVIDIRNFKEG